MKSIKTPGIYTEENRCPSVRIAEVTNGIPAFVGHTEKAVRGKDSLLNIPCPVSSLAEYEEYFGGPPKPVFRLIEDKDGPLTLEVMNDQKKANSIASIMDANDTLRLIAHESKRMFDMAKEAPSSEEKNEYIFRTLDLLDTAIDVLPVNTLMEEANLNFHRTSMSVSVLTDEDDNQPSKWRPLKQAVEETLKVVGRVAERLSIIKAVDMVTDPELRFRLVLLRDNGKGGRPVQLIRKTQNVVAEAMELLNSDNAVRLYQQAVAAIAQVRKQLIIQKLDNAVTATGFWITELAIINNRKIERAVQSKGAVTTNQYTLQREDRFNLYYHIRFFFANGGRKCYIVSVSEGYEKDNFLPEMLAKGVVPLENVKEVDLLLIPEAVYLESDQVCGQLQRTMVKHCALMKDRMAILDIYNGDKSWKYPGTEDVIGSFREQMYEWGLNLAAAYYPWLNTAILSADEVDATISIAPGLLSQAIKTEALALENAAKITELFQLSNRLKESNESAVDTDLHRDLVNKSRVYVSVAREMMRILNLLPPASAIAGIYAGMDKKGGVWAVPANIAISEVISPSVVIMDADQEYLNRPLDGKAVNALRSSGIKETLVWGARTLDGNSQEWRYINACRTEIMLRKSIRAALSAFASEANSPNTWVMVREAIQDFLLDIWKRGGLVGAEPGKSFDVKVGFGTTMTPEDILDGVMKVLVHAAVVNHESYVVLHFEQKMNQ